MGTTASTTLSAKISRLRKCSDFQRNPVAAVRRRLWWRLRWAISSHPWQLKLGDDIEIVAPKSGAGALIYYQRYSEPETARFLTAFLKPGMTFWDVGAHIGEYSLLAARCIGAVGRVHAFEPQPNMFEFLRCNIVANELSNVTSHCVAVSDRVGVADFSLHPEPSMSCLNVNYSSDEQMPSVSVRTTSLDEFWTSSGKIPDVVKVDVEGAERSVLAGGESLLQLPAQIAPIWIMEFDEGNCSRFGYPAKDLLKCFSDYGFATYWIRAGGQLEPTSSTDAQSETRNLVAAKGAFGQ
jgi:FkbM family methyltransferase